MEWMLRIPVRSRTSVSEILSPSQIQYSAEPVWIEVIQLPGLVREDGPGLRSVKERRGDLHTEACSRPKT
ncbi:unnamed protein product [Schistocephalus solidus]|uniref:DUF4283 domain-containing protein n=1 Tax=Schistocephalus solidus TaxID=70667 RepID=A0A183SUG9_SCHSO|nr:unnamed protein product [Schistocephalus solidus]